MKTTKTTMQTAQTEDKFAKFEALVKFVEEMRAEKAARKTARK